MGRAQLADGLVDGLHLDLERVEQVLRLLLLLLEALLGQSQELFVVRCEGLDGRLAHLGPDLRGHALRQRRLVNRRGGRPGTANRPHDGGSRHGEGEKGHEKHQDVHAMHRRRGL